MTDFIKTGDTLRVNGVSWFYAGDFVTLNGINFIHVATKRHSRTMPSSELDIAYFTKAVLTEKVNTTLALEIRVSSVMNSVYSGNSLLQPR